MADADEDSKTEDPTEYRIEKLRQDGKVAISKELILSLQGLAGFSVLYLFWDILTYSILEDLRSLLSVAFLKVDLSGEVFTQILWIITKYTLPMGLFIVVIGLLGGVAQIGLLSQTKVLEPDFNKINPANGIKKYFSARILVEGLKSVLKFSMLGFVLYVVFVSYLPELAILPAFPGLSGLSVGFQMIVVGVFAATGLFVALGIFDLWYQRFQFLRENRMSKHEVKEEMKERDGDPLVKARMRAMARQLANKKMMKDVETATAIIVNPTHYSVAIVYSEDLPSPKVVAKGVDFLALKIRERAKSSHVPIIQNRALARALYKKVKVGQFIPRDFFQAVAEIVAQVLRLKRRERDL